MKKYRVAILGATGAVGRELMKILEEREFPTSELRLLGSGRSEGTELAFRGERLRVRKADERSFDSMDIVLGAAEADVARRFAPAIKRAGALFIDNSSAFRLDEDVPLVVPEINPEDALRERGIISNPNCSTVITLMAIAPIAAISRIETLVASTYQAVSGAGAGGLSELCDQTREWSEPGESAGGELPHSVFPHQIAFNLVPLIGDVTDNGFTSEEMKLQNEGRKILHLPDMKVSCTCVRVPVMRSHSISATVVTKKFVPLDEAREAVGSFPGVVLADAPGEDIYPMPLSTGGQDNVYVGRLRRDLISTRGISLWCCGDQLRKGAATNAVEIAELVIGQWAKLNTRCIA